MLHFGWPDFVHPLSADFTEQFGYFVQATVRFLKRENLPCKFIAPINEISFLAWGGGSVACINPYRQDCGPALKRSLAAAFIRASEILRGEMPDVKILAPDPAIHIAPNPHRDDGEEAVNYTLAQYEALDMIVGAREPELGGKPECLDIVGLNFYDRNQWLHHGEVLLPGHAAYKPFRQMLHEAWQRYQKPVFVSETGTEGFERASWFDYVSTEVAAAVRAGVPVEGLCLYPVVNHPGWEDDRYCENGLLDYPDEDGNRDIYGPLANAIRRQSEKFGWVNGINNAINQFRPGLSISSPLGVRFSEAAAPDDQICEVR